MASSSTYPLNVNSMQKLKIKPKTIPLDKDELKLLIEQVVDFDSFEANGCPLKSYFEFQGWMNFFDMLNGTTYPSLVKRFIG